MKIKHFRVPADVKVGTKGRPPFSVLVPYSRKYGFHGQYRGLEPHAKGGMTLIMDNAGNVIGKSTCSLSENFSYERGRQIALGRALKYGG